LVVFFFGNTGVCTQFLALARQALYQFSHASILTCHIFKNNMKIIGDKIRKSTFNPAPSKGSLVK
jgi:hypothetical protein